MIVSFDDYGMKECREAYEGAKLQETYFSDEKDIYAPLERSLQGRENDDSNHRACRTIFPPIG